MPISVSKLRLTNFRNYQFIDLSFSQNLVTIFGPNGAGKTNILEAISLLSKGSGIRGSEFCDMINNESSASGFTIYGQIDHHPYLKDIGTSYQKNPNKRIFQTENKTSKIHPVIIWLTPQMDGIFLTGKAIRRKFLDKIVCDVNFTHNSRINSYDKLIRERINLLEKYGNDDKWLNIIEQKIAELGVAIAIARNQMVEYLNQAMLLGKSSFIKTKIKIVGELEELASIQKAIIVEENFAKKLKENRAIDLKIGRTSFGTHRSDFTAIMIDKNLEAKYCSTGEQKSMLIALTFARIRMANLLNLPSSILLLDEIVSHLDLSKRSDLFSELNNFDIQCFLTGTDRISFLEIENKTTKKTQFLKLPLE